MLMSARMKRADNCLNCRCRIKSSMYRICISCVRFRTSTSSAIERPNKNGELTGLVMKPDADFSEMPEHQKRRRRLRWEIAPRKQVCLKTIKLVEEDGHQTGKIEREENENAE